MDVDLIVWFCYDSLVEFTSSHWVTLTYSDIITILDGVILVRHASIHTLNGVVSMFFFDPQCISAFWAVDCLIRHKDDELVWFRYPCDYALIAILGHIPLFVVEIGP